MGTSSGTRVAACSSSSPTGSGRFTAGSQRPWLDRGTSLRAAFPRATRSPGVRWVTLRATPAPGLASPSPRCGRVVLSGPALPLPVRFRARDFFFMIALLIRRDLRLACPPAADQHQSQVCECCQGTLSKINEYEGAQLY